ncbi:cell division ATP-binding protein FtsE [Natranaerofaba carboxydovora]|uniref:cell division ATP-binding protein FtsE n=1 Tax=Natranaerofaba carboxydovora TaxID=2742683 RepID=UPI001F137E83|nr:ATP-binding cassette domain-containing protein [Natranaerofaba carboxydovora]
MIKAKSLTLEYDNQTVGIENLNLNIDKGEVVLLLGPSGAGKSSLLKLLMGAKLPTDGVLMVDDHNISPGSKIDITKLRQMISPVFQDFKLLEDKSALENVILGLRVLGHTPGKMQEKSKSALEKVGLGDKLNNPIKFLSYGERQRVAVARAIARDSKIILADEPTGNLDDENSRRIINLLVNLGDEDRVVIIATHERHLVSELNLRTLYLENGKLTKESVVTA